MWDAKWRCQNQIDREIFIYGDYSNVTEKMQARKQRRIRRTNSAFQNLSKVLSHKEIYLESKKSELNCYIKSTFPIQQSIWAIS